MAYNPPPPQQPRDKGKRRAADDQTLVGTQNKADKRVKLEEDAEAGPSGVADRQRSQRVSGCTNAFHGSGCQNCGREDANKPALPSDDTETDQNEDLYNSTPRPSRSESTISVERTLPDDANDGAETDNEDEEAALLGRLEETKSKRQRRLGLRKS